MPPLFRAAMFTSAAGLVLGAVIVLCDSALTPCPHQQTATKLRATEQRLAQMETDLAQRDAAIEKWAAQNTQLANRLMCASLQIDELRRGAQLFPPPPDPAVERIPTPRQPYPVAPVSGIQP